MNRLASVKKRNFGSACGLSGPAREVLHVIASDRRRGHSSFYTRSYQRDVVVTGASEGNEGGRRLSTPRSFDAPTLQNALARPICDQPKPDSFSSWVSDARLRDGVYGSNASDRVRPPNCNLPFM